MLGAPCFIIDAILAITLAWNDWLTGQGLGFLVIPQDAVNTMFELFLFLCGLEEVP